MTNSNTVKLLIKLTPLEPYFFGTDRTFPFDQNMSGGRRAGGYFIRSAQAPSQTTLFGALRYLGIWDPKTDYSLTDGDRMRIGKQSFTLKVSAVKKVNSQEANPSADQAETEQNSPDNRFGKIKRISPLYLTESSYGENLSKGKSDDLVLYCKAPFDHQFKDGKQIGDGKTQKYEHFDYSFARQHITNNGGRCFPTGYDPKIGVVDGWLNIKSGEIHKSSDIFRSVVNVGNNKQEHISGEDDGFFKKEYFLMPKHSFAFFAEVEADFVKSNGQQGQVQDNKAIVSKPKKVLLGSDVVFLGHGNSAFKVEAFADVRCHDNDPEEYVASRLWGELLSPEIVYVQSPLYLNSIGYKHTSELYQDCCFVVSQTTTHRSFETGSGSDSSRIKIGYQNLIRLVSPGSILMSRKPEKLQEFLTEENSYDRQAGFNYLVGQPLLPNYSQNNKPNDNV